MLIPKKCSYGIRAIVYIASKNEMQFVPIKEIADSLNISFHFLTKILQTLSESGILTSVKGPRGGVGLNKNPAELTILDIMRAFSCNNIFDDCILGLPGCDENNPCPMHKSWASLRMELHALLQRETVAELAMQVRNKNIRLSEIV
jgi:Rrf2 family protein